MKYIAVLRTWPQVSEDDCDLEIRTRELLPTDTIEDLMAWVSFVGKALKNVTITISD